MTAKRLAAEFIGTFLIVFAPVAASASNTGLLPAALVSGLSVLAMIYVFGPISSAHFNPAVTLAFASIGRFERRDVLPYLLSQFAGSIAAAFVCFVLFGAAHGVHIPSSENPLRNIGMEVLLSFLLMLVIVAVATDKRVSSTVPAIAIGLVVIVCVLVGGPVTGGSMNPARSFGPAVFDSSALAHVWLYLIAPPIGATVAAKAFEAIRSDVA